MGRLVSELPPISAASAPFASRGRKEGPLHMRISFLPPKGRWERMPPFPPSWRSMTGEQAWVCLIRQTSLHIHTAPIAPITVIVLGSKTSCIEAASPCNRNSRERFISMETQERGLSAREGRGQVGDGGGGEWKKGGLGLGLGGGGRLEGRGECWVNLPKACLCVRRLCEGLL